MSDEQEPEPLEHSAYALTDEDIVQLLKLVRTQTASA